MMSSDASSTIESGSFERGNVAKSSFWLWVMLLGLLMPLVAYGLLPLLGIETLAKLLDLSQLPLLALIGVALGGYVVYLGWIQKRPWWLLAFIVAGWVILEWACFALLQTVHLNLHQRPLILAAFGLPMGLLAWQYKRELLTKLPYFGLFLAFFAWILLYYKVFNLNTTDARMGLGDHSLAGSSIALMKTTAYGYIVLAMAGSGAFFLSRSEQNQSGVSQDAGFASSENTTAQHWFNWLNGWLMRATAVTSIITIVGYPFGPKLQLFSTNLDGFLRATGLYNHPNPFAHAQGILMIYLTGLYFYYTQHAKNLPKSTENPAFLARFSPPSQKLLYLSLGLNLIAFLLGLSKTAMLALAISMAIMLGPQVLTRAQIVFWLKRAWIPVVILPVAALAYQLVSGQSLIEILEKRMADTISFIWRMQSWNILLDGIWHGNWLIGHGFTSANGKLLQLYYSVKAETKPLIQVHNGYIDLLYEFGVMGYLLFVAALAMIRQALSLRPVNVSLALMVVGMAVYYLFVCGFDEMTYMFNAAMLFWVLGTIAVCVLLKMPTPESTGSKI